MTADRATMNDALDPTRFAVVEVRDDCPSQQGRVVEPSLRVDYDWPQRRFAATRDIQDDEHVGPLRSVTASLTREQRYRRGLAVADATAALMTTVITAAIWGAQLRWPLLVVPVAAIFVSKVQGLYDRDDAVLRKSTLNEWRALLRADTLVITVAYLVWWVSIPGFHDHEIKVFAFMLGCLFGLTLPGRAMARRLVRATTTNERCLIVGAPAQCERLAHQLSEVPGVDLIGTVPDGDVDCSVAGVHEIVERLNAERIVVVPHPGWGERGSLKLIQSAKWLGVRVSLMPTVMTVVGASTTVDEFDGLILLGVPRFGLSRSSLALKRALDLAVGTFTLACTLPFMAAVALAVRAESGGPVLFRQKRVGRDGLPFTMYKFRSMIVGAEGMQPGLQDQNETVGLFKMTNDPRVTRVGRVLRRTYLDELPQLFNVLQGNMSLVGPRPLIEPEDALLLGYDRHRSRLTPGMTGPWQLRGPMNATLSELAKLDYMYASNWSIWADIDILLGTAVRVCSRHGH